MISKDEVLRTLKTCETERTILEVNTQELQFGEDDRAIYIDHDELHVTIATRAQAPIALALAHIQSIKIIPLSR